jgi:Tfp pilus assembly ATPase PilU
MQTFDQSLVGLYKDGHATLEDATSAAMSPHDFQLVLKKAGVLDT